MKILNYSNDFTYSEIEQLISLLPKCFQNLNIEIIFPKNKWHCLKWIYLREYFKNIKGIYKSTIGGSSCIHYPKVFIYSFNYDLYGEYGEIGKLRCVQTFYHEIRHQWQRENDKTMFDKYNLNKEYKRNIPYEEQWHEIDAKKFSSAIMNGNIKKIKSILNLL